ncbi:MAG: hypothetical protein R2879_08870 [Saprospiraceae bacterium]
MRKLIGLIMLFSCAIILLSAVFFDDWVFTFPTAPATNGVTIQNIDGYTATGLLLMLQYLSLLQITMENTHSIFTPLMEDLMQVITNMKDQVPLPITIMISILQLQP